jgi:hypothetical protein
MLRNAGGIDMAELSARSRGRLPKSKFAYVDSTGEGHLPIEDEAHVRNAIARWNQTNFESATAREQARKKILAAARQHGIEVSPDDNVAHRAKS